MGLKLANLYQYIKWVFNRNTTHLIKGVTYTVVGFNYVTGKIRFRCFDYGLTFFVELDAVKIK